MCRGIALAEGELPTDFIERYGLRRRSFHRGERPELRFLYRHGMPRLPVWRGGRLQLARWGNRRGESRHLPRTGWTWLETVEQGGWQGLGPIPVEIPATYALEGRGIWYLVEQGIRGMLVPDERGCAVVYVVCEPSTHYYRIMTGAERMPVLIGQRI